MTASLIAPLIPLRARPGCRGKAGRPRPAATDFKRVEKEIYEDSVAYLKEKATYKEIIVFIYDASSSAQEHATTIDALLGVEGIIDVVIASRPSQLPPPGH